MDQALHAGQSLVDAWASAAKAATEGASATSQLLPHRGRSSYLGARALGQPDPGASEIAIVVEALASYFGTTDAQEGRSA